MYAGPGTTFYDIIAFNKMMYFVKHWIKARQAIISLSWYITTPWLRSQKARLLLLHHRAQSQASQYGASGVASTSSDLTLIRLGGMARA